MEQPRQRVRVSTDLVWRGIALSDEQMQLVANRASELLHGVALKVLNLDEYTDFTVEPVCSGHTHESTDDYMCEFCLRRLASDQRNSNN